MVWLRTIKSLSARTLISPFLYIFSLSITWVLPYFFIQITVCFVLNCIILQIAGWEVIWDKRCKKGQKGEKNEKVKVRGKLVPQRRKFSREKSSVLLKSFVLWSPRATRKGVRVVIIVFFVLKLSSFKTSTQSP